MKLEAIYSQFVQQESQPLLLAFGCDRWHTGTFYTEKSTEGFKDALTRGCWHGEAAGRLTRSGAPYVILLKPVSGFLWLVLSWKQRQTWGKLASPDHSWLIATDVLVYSFLGWSLQKLCLAFWIGSGRDTSQVSVLSKMPTYCLFAYSASQMGR